MYGCMPEISAVLCTLYIILPNATPCRRFGVFFVLSWDYARSLCTQNVSCPVCACERSMAPTSALPSSAPPTHLHAHAHLRTKSCKHTLTRSRTRWTVSTRDSRNVRALLSPLPPPPNLRRPIWARRCLKIPQMPRCVFACLSFHHTRCPSSLAHKRTYMHVHNHKRRVVIVSDTRLSMCTKSNHKQNRLPTTSKN